MKRRFGRQIPADMMILSVFSLSLIIGVPVARHLRLVFPDTNKWLFLLIGLAVGFLVLFLFWKALDFSVNLWISRADKRNRKE